MGSGGVLSRQEDAFNRWCSGLVYSNQNRENTASKGMVGADDDEVMENERRRAR